MSCDIWLDIDGNGNSNASEQMLVAYSGSENEDRETEKKTHTQNLDIDCIKKEFFKLSFHSIAHTILLLFYRGKNLLHKCSCSCSLHDAEPTNFGMAGTGSVFFLIVYVNVNVAQNYVIIITIATLFSFRVWVNMSLSTHKTDERKTEIGKKDAERKTETN